MGTITLTGWPKGMDNIHADTELGKDTLRRAVNADILDSGKLRRRRGFSQFITAAGAHSLWSDGKSDAYFVANDHIHQIAGATARDLGAIGTGANRVSFVKENGAVYYLSRSARGRIVGGSIGPWGVDVPASSPMMTTVPGVLEPGKYLAAMTYVLADGRESGASRTESLTLAEPSGIGFYGLPTPAQSGVVKKRLYLSTANGEVLYRVDEIDAVDSVAVANGYGPELRTAYLEPPPFGTGLIFALGRLWIIDGSTVWHTEALDFDHIDRRRNFYQFAEDVSLIAPAKDGIYVCAEKTYFIASAGSSDHSQRMVLDFGAIAGTLAYLPTTGEPIWYSERGAIIGHDGGNAEIVSEKLVSPGAMTEAAGFVRESDSLRQYIAVGNSSNGSSVQCGSYADAEIIRRSQQ